MPTPDGLAGFPLWIEHSGLPALIAVQAKTPLAWLLFRKIVELDIELHREPGVVEVGLSELAARTGMTADQVAKTLPKLRKTGTVRCFLPDNEEEAGLFQIVTPLQTPLSWEDVRREHTELYNLPDHAFRYAKAAQDAPVADDPAKADPRMREMVSLYLDFVSMKLNSFVLDELRFLAERFDIALIRKVFAKAREKEIQSLGWILKEARREQRIKDDAAKARAAEKAKGA